MHNSKDVAVTLETENHDCVTYGPKDAALLYDLILPEHILTVASLHWGCERVAYRLHRRYEHVISCLLNTPSSPGASEDVCAPIPSPVECRHGDPHTLPFGQGSMQCLLLHHTLEDVPGNRQQKKEYRAGLLRACKSVLAPDGVLAVASNNRWNSQELRKALRKSSSGNGGQRFGYGLSFWTCRRLLRRAGFLTFDAYAVIPNVDHPDAIISMQRTASSAYYGRIEFQTMAARPWWGKLSIKVLNALNVRSQLEPSFLILARP